MENLPQYKDVLQEICSYLTNSFDIIHMSQVNQNCSTILGQDYFKMLCDHRGINLKLNSLLHINNWKKLYIDQVIYNSYTFILDDKFQFKFSKFNGKLRTAIGDHISGFEVKYYELTEYMKNKYIEHLADSIVSSESMKNRFFLGGLSPYKAVRRDTVNCLYFYKNNYTFGMPQQEVLHERKQLELLLERAVYSVMKYGEVLFLVGRNIAQCTNIKDASYGVSDLDCGIELKCERNYHVTARDYRWIPEYLYYWYEDKVFEPRTDFFPKKLRTWIDNDVPTEVEDDVDIGPFIFDEFHKCRLHVGEEYINNLRTAGHCLDMMIKVKEQQERDWHVAISTIINAGMTAPQSTQDENMEFVDDPDLCDEEEDQPEDGN